MASTLPGWNPWSSWVKLEVLTAAHPASSPRSVAQLLSSEIKVSISVFLEENNQITKSFRKHTVKILPFSHPQPRHRFSRVRFWLLLLMQPLEVFKARAVSVLTHPGRGTSISKAPGRERGPRAAGVCVAIHSMNWRHLPNLSLLFFCQQRSSKTLEPPPRAAQGRHLWVTFPDPVTRTPRVCPFTSPGA